MTWHRRRRHTLTLAEKEEVASHPKMLHFGKEGKKVTYSESISAERTLTLSSATRTQRTSRGTAPSQDSNTIDSYSRIKGQFCHLDYSPIRKAPIRKNFLRRGIEELRVRVEMGVIRVCCHGCLDDVLRLAVRAAGHAGGGVLDVDIVDGIAAAQGDDEPGGIVGRIENVAAVEIASCYGYCVGFGVESVVIAVEVEELEGRIGVQMLALVTQEGGAKG